MMNTLNLNEHQRFLKFALPISLIIAVILVIVALVISGSQPGPKQISNASPSGADQNFAQGVNNAGDKNPILKLIGATPYIDPSNLFSVEYSWNKNIVYVYLDTRDESASKSAFLLWFSQFKIPQNGVNIYYYPWNH